MEEQVCTNVVAMLIALFGTYSVMYVLEKLLNYASRLFNKRV